MARGISKKKVKEVPEVIETVSEAKTVVKEVKVESLQTQIVNWLTRKTKFDNMNAQQQKLVLDKSKRMIAAGYEMVNGVPVQVIK